MTLDTKAIRERAEACTPGPWEAYRDGCAECDKQKTSEWNVNGVECGYHGQFEYEATAQFIAHARTDIPALLSALEAAERTIAELRKDRAEGVGLMVNLRQSWATASTNVESDLILVLAWADSLSSGAEGENNGTSL